MERAIDRVGELLVGGDREEQVAGLHRDLVVAEVMILEDADMVERAFDQRFGAGLAIFFEQILFEASGIDPDADRAAIGLGRVDHFAHPLGRADIAGVDAQACGAGVGRLERALVVEMDVGDDRHARGARDLLQCRAASTSGQETRMMSTPASSQRRIWSIVARRVVGRRVGHRLDGDRRVAADGDIADHDLPRTRRSIVRQGRIADMARI